MNVMYVVVVGAFVLAHLYSRASNVYSEYSDKCQSHDPVVYFTSLLIASTLKLTPTDPQPSPSPFPGDQGYATCAPTHRRYPLLSPR